MSYIVMDQPSSSVNNGVFRPSALRDAVALSIIHRIARLMG